MKRPMCSEWYFHWQIDGLRKLFLLLNTYTNRSLKTNFLIIHFPQHWAVVLNYFGCLYSYTSWYNISYYDSDSKLNIFILTALLDNSLLYINITPNNLERPVVPCIASKGEDFNYATSAVVFKNFKDIGECIKIKIVFRWEYFISCSAIRDIFQMCPGHW